jgi:hypothetical protein
MTSFDPVAAAVDWLDAHRAAALDSLLPLYDDGASLECSCGGQKVIVGKGAIARYWRQRFVDAPALDLEDIQLAGNSVTVSYRIPGGIVEVILDFNGAGRIERSRCGPAAEVTSLRRG